MVEDVADRVDSGGRSVARRLHGCSLWLDQTFLAKRLSSSLSAPHRSAGWEYSPNEQSFITTMPDGICLYPAARDRCVVHVKAFKLNVKTSGIKALDNLSRQILSLFSYGAYVRWATADPHRDVPWSLSLTSSSPFFGCWPGPGTRPSNSSSVHVPASSPRQGAMVAHQHLAWSSTSRCVQCSTPSKVQTTVRVHGPRVVHERVGEAGSRRILTRSPVRRQQGPVDHVRWRGPSQAISVKNFWCRRGPSVTVSASRRLALAGLAETFRAPGLAQSWASSIAPRRHATPVSARRSPEHAAAVSSALSKVRSYSSPGRGRVA